MAFAVEAGSDCVRLTVWKKYRQREESLKRSMENFFLHPYQRNRKTNQSKRRQKNPADEMGRIACGRTRGLGRIIL